MLVILSEAFICVKIRAIYSDLQQSQPTTSQSEFLGTKGWLSRFRVRVGLYSVVHQGEAISADVSAAKEYVNVFENIRKDLPQQVLNCDETGLFWKKLPT